MMAAIDQIYDHMKEHGSITVLDGYKMIPPCTCVGQRITDLKKVVQIVDRWEESNGKRYKRWSIKRVKR
jgi:hypothetical protein